MDEIDLARGGRNGIGRPGPFNIVPLPPGKPFFELRYEFLGTYITRDSEQSVLRRIALSMPSLELLASARLAIRSSATRWRRDDHRKRG